MNANVHAIFEYLVARDALHPGFANSSLRSLFKSGLGSTTSSLVLNALSKPKQSHGYQYLYSGTLFPDLIQSFNPGELCLLGSHAVARIGIPSRIPYWVTGNDRLQLWHLYYRDPKLVSKHATRLLNKMERRIRKIRPKMVIATNDSLPAERLLLEVCRRQDIPSFCIQHGLFQSDTDWRIWDGHFADHMLVWGERQANAYIGNGMSPSKVHILGLPYSPNRNSASPMSPGSVCLLGQPWETVTEKLGKLKLEIFEAIFADLKKAGIRCVYKPHPAEKSREFFPSEIPIFRGTLAEAFEHFSTFASLTSTALLEATLHGRVAVQIFHPAFESDVFEDVGYSYTIDSKDSSHLVNIASTEQEPFTIPSSLIKINHSPATQLRILTENIVTGTEQNTINE